MAGRTVHLASIAAVAAVGAMLSVTSASAGCMSCGCSAPVVYSYYSYAPPCGSYALPPMFVVNQGPAYTLPVPISAEPTPSYSYVGVPASYEVEEPYYGAQPYYGAPRYYGVSRWDRRYVRPRYGYQGYRYEEGYRRGARVFSPYLNAGRFYGERMSRFAPRFANAPRARYNARYVHPTPMRAPAAPEPGYVQPMR